MNGEMGVCVQENDGDCPVSCGAIIIGFSGEDECSELSRCNRINRRDERFIQLCVCAFGLINYHAGGCAF